MNKSPVDDFLVAAAAAAAAVAAVAVVVVVVVVVVAPWRHRWPNQPISSFHH